MTELKKISDLRPGDIVRGKFTHRTFQIVAVYGDRATAVSIQDLTNPHEWEVLRIEDQIKKANI